MPRNGIETNGTPAETVEEDSRVESGASAGAAAGGAGAGAGGGEGRRHLPDGASEEIAHRAAAIQQVINSLPEEVKSNPTLLQSIISGILGGNQAAPAAAVSSSSVSAREELLSSTRDSIVMINNSSEVVNLQKPGLEGRLQKSRGSGVVIDAERRWILTNDHVTSNYKSLNVKFSDAAKAYTAEVVYTSKECDLSIVTVSDDEFWARVKPAEFADADASRGEEIRAIGFPMGGETISFTEGSLSRTDSSIYANSGISLPISQISTPINPGNSGGPAFDSSRKIVGITHQGLTGSQNISYMIPLTIVNKFLDAAKAMAPQLFPTLHLRSVPLMNKAAREHAGLTDDHDGQGVLVSEVARFSAGEGIVHVDDVLLEIDGYPISNKGKLSDAADGTSLPPYINSLQTYVHMKNIGDTINLKVLRDGVEQVVSLELNRAVGELDILSNKSKKPLFYINNGLVFYQVNEAMLEGFGGMLPLHPDMVRKISGHKRESIEEAPIMILDYFDNTTEEGATYGYPKVPGIIQKVNGEDIVNIKHLKEVMEANDGPYHTILLATEHPLRIVIPNLPAPALLEKLRSAGYAHQCSPELLDVAAVALEDVTVEASRASAGAEAGGASGMREVDAAGPVLYMHDYLAHRTSGSVEVDALDARATLEEHDIPSASSSSRAKHHI